MIDWTIGYGGRTWLIHWLPFFEGTDFEDIESAAPKLVSIVRITMGAGALLTKSESESRVTLSEQVEP